VILAIFHHVGQQFAEQRIVDPSISSSPRQTAIRLVNVALRVAIKHVLDLGKDEIGHVFTPRTTFCG